MPGVAALVLPDRQQVSDLGSGGGNFLNGTVVVGHVPRQNP